MYELGKRDKTKRRRRRLGLVGIVCLVAVSYAGYSFVRGLSKPQVTITQAKTTQTKLNFEPKIKHYDQPDFSLDLPTIWHAVPKPAGPYNSFTWQTSDDGNKWQQLIVYEDTAPPNVAVNRALIVSGQADRLAVGAVSENCVAYTKNSAPGSLTGTPAKWQNVDFLCDTNNYQRNVIGTSSTEGVNTVTLKGTAGTAHKFFFMFTATGINPDFTDLTSALQSLRMK